MDAAVTITCEGPKRRRVVSLVPEVKNPSLMIWMVLAIGVVAVLAFWDARRESAAELKDFADEQTALAEAVATTLRAQQSNPDPLPCSVVPSVPSAAPRTLTLPEGTKARRFFSEVRAIERPHSVRLFVQSVGGPAGLTTSDGRVIRSRIIESGLASGASWARLTRSDALTVGLPPRTAMAGLARVDLGATGRWGIAVVASAQRTRDRELLAQWRLVLSVLVASGLVLVFGGLAVRNQRKQLLLSQELAIASLQSHRDERLVRADKLATMGALATGIAHEVSTPLGVITGRAEQLMLRLNGDERSKRAVEAIAQQAERISEIVRGFLALARGDAPRMERVEPGAIGRVAAGLVEHRFAKADVRLSTSVANELPPVACEPRLMEQVLVNLLLNACDACAPGGHVELRVVAERERVAFVVDDDGTGISSDAAARIMEPFFTTKSAGEGSGLGLAIANELVKHHRGTLSVAAREGHRGTRACVELPSATEQNV